MIKVTEERSVAINKQGNPTLTSKRVKLFGFIPLYKKITESKDGSLIKK